MTREQQLHMLDLDEDEKESMGNQMMFDTFEEYSQWKMENKK